MEQLSEQGRNVQELLQRLTPYELATIFGQAVTALGQELSEAAPTASAPKRAKAQAALNQGVAEKLISNAGGIFLGEKQLKDLGLIDNSVTVLPVPQKFSRAFLDAKHPLRGGRMAEHIILGFDTKTREWYCFEKSIVPGSLGTDGKGLSGPEQDKLLLDENRKPKTVQGMQYTSPTDYRPIESVLDNVITLQCARSVAVEALPFFGVWGAHPADTANASHGCRVLVGYSNQNGSRVFLGAFLADEARNVIGLLAGWN